MILIMFTNTNIKFCLMKSMDPSQHDKFIDMATTLCTQVPKRVLSYPFFGDLQYAIFYSIICKEPDITALLKRHYLLNLN